MLSKSKFSLVVLILCAVSFINTSCSRNPKPSLSLSLKNILPEGNSGQSVNEIEYAVINFQMVGRAPVVKEFDFDGGQPVSGQTLELTIDNVPTGNALVQFLGVFKNSTTGVMKITYGDKDLVINGSTEVTITPTDAGTVTKQMEIAGRYITSNTAGDERGPTGTLVMQYQPPGGRPKMNMSLFPIVDGWFKAMALDGVSFDFTLLETNEVIFPQLNTSSPMLGKGTGVLSITKPLSFTSENGKIRTSGETEYLMGFFAASGVTLGTKYACHPEVYSGGEAMLKDVSAAGVPIEFCIEKGVGCAGQTAQTRITQESNNGYEAPFPAFYRKTDSACNDTSASANVLQFYHVMMNGNGGDKVPAGIRPPFLVMNPFDGEQNGYMTAKYNNSVRPTWNLEWRFVADIDDTIDGVDVLAKFYSGGSDNGGGGGMDSCSRLLQQGFGVAGTVARTAVPNNLFAFTNLLTVNGHTLDHNDRFNWHFGACAFRMENGVKKYVGEYIRRSCLGSCPDKDMHYGWASASAALTVSAPTVFDNAAGGTVRMTTINSFSYTHYTQLSTGSLPPPFMQGNEVMLQVLAKTQGADCGTYNGTPITPGMHTFTRILATGPSSIYIPKGTFVDGLDSFSTTYGSSVYGSSCYLQAVKVPHYRNLTIEDNAEIEANTIDLLTYNGGGVVAYRVNGVTTFGDQTSLNATGHGYWGGNLVDPDGFGPDGSSTGSCGGRGSFSGNTDGTPPYLASGGGGGGIYGMGSGNGAPPGLNRFGGFWSGGGYFGGVLDARFGCGGGMGYTMSGGVTYDGGNGGGMVVLVTRELATSTYADVTIKAQGTDAGTITTSYAGGGGGGGGSAFIFARKSENFDGFLNVYANGGAGAWDGGNHLPNDGAGGGGGLATAVICDFGGAGIDPSYMIINADGGYGFQNGATQSKAQDGVWSRSNGALTVRRQQDGTQTSSQSQFAWACGMPSY